VQADPDLVVALLDLMDARPVRRRRARAIFAALDSPAVATAAATTTKRVALINTTTKKRSASRRMASTASASLPSARRPVQRESASPRGGAGRPASRRSAAVHLAAGQRERRTGRHAIFSGGAALAYPQDEDASTKFASRRLRGRPRDRSLGPLVRSYAVILASG